ncbi:TrkH family potassium uptake protein, partial [Pseudomonas sp. SIMBA_064]
MPLPALHFIAFILGVFLITLAVSMVIPMATLLLYDRSDDLESFV